MGFSVYHLAANVCGWTYTGAWILLSYPQIFLNWRRKSVVGFSLDFLLFDVFGAMYYMAFTWSLFFSNKLHDLYYDTFLDRQYRDRPPLPTKVNDLALTCHALVAVLVMALQCRFYNTGDQAVNWLAKLMVQLSFLGTGILSLLSAVGVLSWVWCLVGIGLWQSLFTALRYIPQIYLNRQRAATSGFSIYMAILQTIGGVCSIMQMVLDAIDQKSVSDFKGNLPKVLFGAEVTIMSLVVLFQHYILYPHSRVEHDFDATLSAPFVPSPFSSYERSPLVVEETAGPSKTRSKDQSMIILP